MADLGTPGKKRVRGASSPARLQRHDNPQGPLAVVALLLTAMALGFVALPCAGLLLRVHTAQIWSGLWSDVAREALLLTLKTSVAATVVCVLAGTPVAFLLARMEIPGKRVVDATLQLPLVLPPVVAGVGLLLAFGRNGLLGRSLGVLGIEIPFTTAAVVMAQVFMAMPFYVQAARAGIEGVPRSVEEASRTLGASDSATFFRVTIPLSRHALLSGMLLCWGRAVGEFGATIMFAGNMRGVTRTMPLAILTAMQENVDAAAALSVLLLAFSAVIFVGARWALGGTGAAR